VLTILDGDDEIEEKLEIDTVVRTIYYTFESKEKRLNCDALIPTSLAGYITNLLGVFHHFVSGSLFPLSLNDSRTFKHPYSQPKHH
jgi:hypothetical protein